MQQDAQRSYLAIKQACPSWTLRGNFWLQQHPASRRQRHAKDRTWPQLHASLPCLAVQEVACHPLAQQSAVLAELIAEAKASQNEVENLSPNSQV